MLFILTPDNSQGSALMNAAISKLDDATKTRIVGVVLFGYTKNAQNGGKIDDFPANKVKTFCSASDGVCGGALLVTAGHFTYLRNGDGQEATDFLVKQISGA
jgi:cutinase